MELKNNVSHFQMTVSKLRSIGMPVHVYSGDSGLQIAIIGDEYTSVNFSFDNKSELNLKEEKK